MYADRFGLNDVQLHGNESPEYCRSLHSTGLKIIKAFSVDRPKDLKKVYDYEKVCDLFLFDTKCEQYGGSGNQFDWSILHTYNGDVPFLLSGGINSYSANALKEFKHPGLPDMISTAVSNQTGRKRSGAYPDIFKRIKIITLKFQRHE